MSMSLSFTSDSECYLAFIAPRQNSVEANPVLIKSSGKL